MVVHATGYRIDHPLAIASRNSNKHWPMALLMEGRPFQAAPLEYLDPHIGLSALDQDNVGACVAFAATNIKQAQEHADWGTFKFDTVSAFKTYNWLKHGTPGGEYPGDGISGEGSYPEAVLKLAKIYGIPDKNGALHKIEAYYSHSFSGSVDLEFLKQVILAFGPVDIGMPWPNNWFGDPPAPDYKVPAPGGASSGHSFAIAGWKPFGGEDWLAGIQTWGTDWSNTKGLFYFKASWLFQQPLGPQIIWKSVDYKDAPAPPPPVPAGEIMKAADAQPRLVDCVVGTQLYKTDGVTPLVKISSGGLNLYSPFAFDTDKFAVRISSGGILQIVTVKKSACTNIRLIVDGSVAAATERKRWTDWHATYPK